MRKRQSENRVATVIQVNGRSFKAIPLQTDGDEALLMVNTGRRSSVVAKSQCASCGSWMNKHELQTCPQCSCQVCSDCLQPSEESVLSD